MLQNIVVGPPMVGATDLKSSTGKNPAQDFKGSDSDSSFERTLEDRMTSQSSREMKESSPKQVRQKEAEDSPPQKSDKAKTETEVVKPEGKISKKTAVRQQAIQEFMDSFESEFEIPPTRLVEAMAQLDDTQLAQPPEVTAQAVIDQLGLDESEADKARAMYASLLMQLNQLPQQPKPAPELVTGTSMSPQQIQERILASQGRQDILSSSVDRVNQKFWHQAQTQTQDPAPVLEEGMATLSQIPEGKMPAKMTELPPLPPHLQGQMKETASPALLAALAAQQEQAAVQAAPVMEASSAQGAQELLAESDGSEIMDEFQQALQAPAVKMEKPEASAKAGMAVYSAPNAGKMSQEFFQNSSQQDSALMQQQQPKSRFAQEAKAKITEGLTEKSTQSFEHHLTGLESIHGAPIKGEPARLGLDPALAPAGTIASQAPSGVENDAAVKQLMSQAQYLIKKGGGEMKVEMTPEGMGTVHLKVMLQDGKVNLQMSAETAEAKKTIESSLAELKTSLAAHKLSMENVKVDVVNSTSADTATQNQTNANGQQRDQTRQFWNQFNENFGSQGRRESFSEMPNLRGYGNRGRDPLQPIEVSSQPRARQVEGKGSGLNLVA